MGKSIYKSDAGRQTMARWYEHFLLKSGRSDIRFKQVQTRFGQTQILVAGDEEAPPLWCFHGAMANASVGFSQIHKLADSFQIFFPDMIGQPGRSDETYMDWQGLAHGQWVLDILDALEIESIRAFGVSLGGYVVLRSASLAPARIERAALWVPGGVIKGHMGDMLSLIFAGLAYAIRPTPERLARIMEKNFTSMDEDWAGYFGDSLAHVNPDRRFPATLKPGALSHWEAPVLLLTNGQDRVFPAHLLEPAARTLIPNIVQVEHLEGFKHAPPVEPGAIDEPLAKIAAFMS